MAKDLAPTPTAAESTSPALNHMSYALLGLLVAIASPLVLIVVGVMELGMSGSQPLVGSVSEPAPFVLRLVALLPLWAVIAAPFYFTTREQKVESSPALFISVVALLISMAVAFGAVYLSIFALAGF